MQQQQFPSFAVLHLANLFEKWKPRLWVVTSLLFVSVLVSCWLVFSPFDWLIWLLCKGIVHAFGGGGWAPTTLAQRLSPSTLAEESQQGFLVLENNFRVYAYTQSLLHIRILSMFVRLEYRLPNLVVGTITRKSALRALIEYGVTSAQLLSYLRSNAHPRMRSRSPVVPDVITDQLRAWFCDLLFYFFFFFFSVSNIGKRNDVVWLLKMVCCLNSFRTDKRTSWLFALPRAGEDCCGAKLGSQVWWTVLCLFAKMRWMLLSTLCRR